MTLRLQNSAHLKNMHLNLNVHFDKVARQMEQISSGQRVNRSSDDAASVGSADGLQAEMRVLSQGSRSIQQSHNLLQIADTALAEISQMLQRMKALAIQSSSSTINDDQRQATNSEFQQLKNEMTRMAESTEYNGLSLLTSDTKDIILPAGPSGTSNDLVEFNLGDMRASGSTIQLDGVSVDVQNSSITALDIIDQAIEKIIQVRSQLGALQNRFELSVDATNSFLERVQGIESSIRDADIAQAVSHMTRSQIMSQTATSLAKEADVDIEGLLSLLR